MATFEGFLVAISRWWLNRRAAWLLLLVYWGMWAIMLVSMTALIAGIFIAAFLIPEGMWQLVTILGICVVFLIPCFYALKLEVSVGAYKCKNCGYEIVYSVVT